MAWEEKANSIPFGDIINWNTDRTVTPVTMVHGMMGKNNGSWVYLQVTSTGALVTDGGSSTTAVSAATAPLSVNGQTVLLNTLSTGGLVLSANKLAVGTSSWISRDANGIKLDSTSSGTFSGTLVFSGTNTHTTDVYMNGDMWMTSAHAIAFTDNDASNYVGFRAPATVSVNSIWNLPSADGAANQVLQTNGSGALSWQTITAGTGTVSAAVAPLSVQTATMNLNTLSTGGLVLSANTLAVGVSSWMNRDANGIKLDSTSSGTFSGNLAFTGTNTFSGSNTFSGLVTHTSAMYLSANAPLRFYGTGTTYTAIVGATTPTTVTMTLPSSNGSSGDTFKTDGSGVLSWQSIPVGTVSTASVPLYITNADIALSTLSTGGLVLSANKLAVGTSSWISRDANGIKLDSTSSGTFSGNLAFTGTDTFSGLVTHTSAMYLSANNAVRFYGTGNTYTALVGATTPTTVTMVLPSSNGSSGDFLTTNGSGTLSWNTAGSTATPKVVTPCPFENIGTTGNKYSFGALGSGTTFAAAEGGIAGGTAGANGAGCALTLNNPGGLDTTENLFDDNFEIWGSLIFTSSTTSGYIGWLTGGTGTRPTQATGALTAKHIGFIIDSALEQASNANGTTQTVTDIAASIVVTVNNTVRAVMNGSTNCKFYVNKTLAATHTTNLPSGAPNTGGLADMGIRNDSGNTTNRTISIGNVVVAWNAE